MSKRVLFLVLVDCMPYSPFGCRVGIHSAFDCVLVSLGFLSEFSINDEETMNYADEYLQVLCCMDRVSETILSPPSLPPSH